MENRYPENLRKAAVTKFINGQSAKEVCAEYGIARSTLFLWKKQYTTDKIGQIPREQYLLKKELDRLRMENTIFKTCNCSPSSSLSEKLSAIHGHKDKFSTHALCRVLNVNRSTYYHYALRSPEKKQIQLQDDKLKPLIGAIFEKSCGRFGARKIRVKLAEQGHIASERRILRLMKELGLSATGTKPRLNSANDRQYQYYPNKLKRNFLTDAPNKVWVSDITYAKVGMDFLYLCVVIDLYSRKVIGHSISENIDADLALSAFHQSYLARQKPINLTFHSDQGSQYTAFEFRNALRNYGVVQSFSAPGSPHDNAVAESFFATIKKEDFRRNYYKTENEFRIAVAKYIEFYNDYRPPSATRFFDAKSSGNGILSHGIRIKENAYSIDQSEKDCPNYCRHSSCHAVPL